MSIDGIGNTYGVPEINRDQGVEADKKNRKRKKRDENEKKKEEKENRKKDRKEPDSGIIDIRI